MGNFLIVGGGGEVTLIKALASGAFDHLNCKHTRKFDQNFSKKQTNKHPISGRLPLWAGGGMGSLEND